ncbi:MAG: hypothetical protein IIZ88_07265 [Prevotella sp.]|nr:hypothetical protein [Prevotella sp.]
MRRLLFALAFMGVCCMVPAAAQQDASTPSSSEIYQKELDKVLNDNPYDSLMNDESRVLFQNMHQQLEEIQSREEQGATNWPLILILCGITLLLFLVRFFYYYFKDSTSMPSVKELFVVIGAVLVIGVVLYMIDVGFSYLRFFANDKYRLLATAIALIVCFILLWRKTFKNAADDDEDKQQPL